MQDPSTRRKPAPPLDRTVYLVALRAEGEGPPTPIRLRHLLKSALRAWGLRCVSVEERKGRADCA